MASRTRRRFGKPPSQCCLIGWRRAATSGTQASRLRGLRVSRPQDLVTAGETPNAISFATPCAAASPGMRLARATSASRQILYIGRDACQPRRRGRLRSGPTASRWPPSHYTCPECLVGTHSAAENPLSRSACFAGAYWGSSSSAFFKASKAGCFSPRGSNERAS